MRETCFISAAHRAALIRALDFFFIMNLERRKQLIIKWSPLLLICFLVMAALSFWHKPLSLSQTAFLLAIGLLYGGLALIYWKTASDIIIIFNGLLGGLLILFMNVYLFQNVSSWEYPLQIFSIMFIGFFGLLTLFKLWRIYSSKNY